MRPAAAIDTASGRDQASLLAHIYTGETTGRKNFIWIRRNPLKSPNSAKGIQGNPSDFVWFYLVFFGQICIGLCSRRIPPGHTLTPPEPLARSSTPSQSYKAGSEACGLGSRTLARISSAWTV